jgi:hypothetical protein
MTDDDSAPKYTTLFDHVVESLVDFEKVDSDVQRLIDFNAQSLFEEPAYTPIQCAKDWYGLIGGVPGGMDVVKAYFNDRKYTADTIHQEVTLSDFEKEVMEELDKLTRVH